ncbi:hypothetical protein M409DRAFT_25602 [Zasmidium cellare ATCC 36951]|uniref:Rhodopsin domain-containing protein n=1 Tax=Zasmidium cellare ATCC 36951 TaxID=1080233 RepID=A0A6A6CF09_ZASCE|nr:uncharacterized protein M409DRAFT_25602 [Zasmidium cellare ATCC 36951]KAF2164259.1 hypothetical protein M409DRAFT_25602 [Zasmidium cellare ATCC 36951]
MPPTDPNRTPAAPAPPGFTSNLSKGKMTKDTDSSIAIAIVGMLISTTFFIIRIYTKAVLAKLFGVDDVLLIIAWILSMVVQISIVYYMAHEVIGAHIWDLSVADFQRLARITAVDSVVYLVVMALCKFSILLFYLRLSRERWFTYSIYATMGLVVGYSFSLACSLIFACIPLKMVWDVTITDGHCINRGKIYLATAGLNAATDIIMLVGLQPRLPMLEGVIAKSHAGFTHANDQEAPGSFQAEGGPWFNIRHWIVHYGYKHRSPLLDASIGQGGGHELAVAPATWICIEGSLLIWTASLPIMRLFLKHVAPRLIGETSIHRSGSRRSRQKPDTIGSSELSTLEKSKRSYARMTDTAIIGHSPTGSETGIIGSSGKNGATVATVERREYAHDSLTPREPPAAPTPYSQLSVGAEIFPTPPLDRRDSAVKEI